MWDYLIITAGNEAQAAAYRALLEERRELGLIPDVDKVLVVPDAKGRRIGSGGSTILCLLEVLNREIATARSAGLAMTNKIFSGLRILIVHAGGDSRRLPAYGPCGKIFVPIPGESDQAVPLTIFDRLLPTYLALPPNAPGRGQIVVASGDVLLFFDPGKVRFDREGITGLGAFAAPDTSKNHGVFCATPDGRVQTYLQKPSVEEQAAQGAVDHAGQSILDIGVFQLDGQAAARLLSLCNPVRNAAGKWAWSGALVPAIEEFGLDFYREITSALGTETGAEDYVASVRRAGSHLPEKDLRRIQRTLAGTPLFVSILPRCDFLHFGTSCQLIESGQALQGDERHAARHRAFLDINNEISGNGAVIGLDSWVEGCRIHAPLTLGGENIVVGADVEAPMALPPKTVLDVIEGKDRRGKDVLFVRCYGIGDGGVASPLSTLANQPLQIQKRMEIGGKWRRASDLRSDNERDCHGPLRGPRNDTHSSGGSSALFNVPVEEWLKLMGARPEDVWNAGIRGADRSIWNGRFFPAVTRAIADAENPRIGVFKQVIARSEATWRSRTGLPRPRGLAMTGGIEQWLWMLEPGKATAKQKKAWKAADRYSFEEMARLASPDAFHDRRRENRADEILANASRILGPRSGFSARELYHVLRPAGVASPLSTSASQRPGIKAQKEKSGKWRRDPDIGAELAAGIIRDAFRIYGTNLPGPGIEKLALSRIFHSLGSAVIMLAQESGARAVRLMKALDARLTAAERDWLGTLNIPAPGAKSPRAWARAAHDAAFDNIGRTIVMSSAPAADPPRCALRSDEIVWGRAPARFDLGGGWSDTPPYSLEHGGCVINAAANLNGQPPIQVYARVTAEPKIGIFSIDHGASLSVRTLDELLDYRKPASRFGLAKAALALSGFSPDTAAWPKGTKTLADMLKKFGGGIELTTLAAIPSGSGLGTSSIMGAVLMAVVNRLMGRTLGARELFHKVLQLEQELTTGGGWQDQVGGVLPGVKVITAEPGLIPDPRIHYVTADLLDPAANRGQTLLYYTGLRRLAKNILRHVVGRYLDRDRDAMRTLRALHSFPPELSAAMAAKDMKKFGELINVAWDLKKRIDPDSTTKVIEGILGRIRPHIYGATLLGAGGGGFLLIIAKSPEDAAALRADLEADPPNARARFFNYDISREGLSITVC